jgi:hypothetical protein
MPPHTLDDPLNLSPDDRRRQVAAILASGVLRHLRAAQAAASSPPRGSLRNCLDAAPESRRHGVSGAAGERGAAKERR